MPRGVAAAALLLAAAGLVGCEHLSSGSPPADLVVAAETPATSPIQTGSVGRSAQRTTSIGSGRSSDDVFTGIESTGSGNFTTPRITSNIATVDRTPTGADGITLNLLNVPLELAAKNVLGDLLKLNYSIADKVGGNITIQTTSPMHKDALLEVFEAVLKTNGLALVRGTSHFRIVPAANAAQAGANLASGTRREGAGTHVQVVTLRFVAASEMKRIIEPAVAPGAVLRADDSRGLLMVTGTTQELQDIAELVQLFDADWMRGMSFGFYPVQSSDTEAIARELQAVLGIDKDSPLKGTVRVLPNQRLSSIMVISSRPGALAIARKWIEQLDKVAENGEERLFVYKIRNRGATELANLLQRVLGRDAGAQQRGAIGGVGPRFEPTALSTSSEAGFDPTRPNGGFDPLNGGPTSSVSNGTQPIVAGGPGAGIIVPNGRSTGGTGASSGVSASVVTTVTGATDGLGQNGLNGQFGAGRAQKVVADEANNSLLITTTRKEFRRIEQIMETIDVMPTQVMLEAMIAEVTLTDELKFGVKWAFQNQTSKHLNSIGVTDIPAISAGSAFSYLFKAPHLTAVIDAVSSVTKVNVVSAPSLMVLDNKKATLQIGDQVPIVTQQSQAVVVVGGPVINSITLKDTGIILNVTPRVNDSGRILLEIDQEASNVIRTVTSGIDSPTIQQRKIHTTVVVADGEVIVLGGMIQERDTTTKTQVPLLGNLPIVGAAFRNKDDTINRTELMVFIRPQVVRNPEEARNVTSEFRRQINLAPPVSLQGRDNYDRDGKRILR